MELAENENSVFSTGLDILLQQYPELQEVIVACFELPEQIENATT